MRTIDISEREKMTITGDLSHLRIPFGIDAYAEIVIGEQKSYFALFIGGRAVESELANQGITYDFGSSIQWTEVDYTGVDIEFWGGGRVAVFTIHYRRSRDTSSDGGIYESMRPYEERIFVDTVSADSISLEEATALSRAELPGHEASETE